MTDVIEKPPARHANTTLVVLYLSLGGLAFAVLQSLVAPALPVLAHDLQASTGDISWVLTAYLLSASVLTPILGRLGDISGKRKVLLAAADGADLLVVDAPRTFTGAPMFAQRLVYAAACPVVVMPPSITAEPPGMLARAGRAMGRAAVRSAGLAGRPGYRPPLLRD